MEQKNISFNKGIHRTPSIGDSGELSECVNLIPRFGELQNIEPPKLFNGISIPSGHELIYVHKKSGTGGYTNYITKKDGKIYANKLISSNGSSSTETNELANLTPLSITSIGNTLCVSSISGVHYFVWKYDLYKPLGNHIPEIKLSFGLAGGEYGPLVNSRSIKNTQYGDSYFNIYDVEEAREAAFSDIHEVEDKIRRANKFSYPFLVRYAAVLYDGSTTMHSSPILMIPNDDGTPLCTVKGSVGTLDGVEQEIVVFKTYMMAASLTYKTISSSNLSDWSDIIRGVKIYCSSQFRRYSETIPVEREDDKKIVVQINRNPRKFNAIIAASTQTGAIVPNRPDNAPTRSSALESDSSTLSEECKRNTFDHFDLAGSGDTSGSYGEFPLETIDNDAYKKKISSESSFYEITDLTLDNVIGTTTRQFVPIKDGTISSLETQSPLIEDTNKSHEFLRGSKIMSYNSRLIMWDSKRLFTGSIDLSSCINCISPSGSMKGYIEINDDGVNRLIELTTSYPLNIASGLYYFFYPNPKATKAHIFYGTNSSIKIELQPHPTLLGAVWCGGISYAATESEKTENELSQLASDYEKGEENILYASNVDNPFVFKGSNAVTFASSILQVSSSTKALSQGQFGQFPLYAFCEDGIWAVSVSSEGKLESKQPVNRDVLLNDNCVCQLDDSVAYLTKEGMKIISGSQAECISTPLHGLNVDDTTGSSILSAAPSDYDGLIIPDKNAFHSHISEDNCMMLYDYPHRLIHLFTHTLNTSYNAHFVYSRDSQEWSMQKLDASYNNASTITAKTVVPGYPLSYLQSGYDLYQYDHLNDVSNIRKGYFLTRPEALSNPFSRKCLYDLRLFGQKTLNSSKWKVVVLVSNDLQHWAKLTSLKGLSAKYYRFMVFTEFTDVDTLSGMALQYEERYGNKLR